MSGRDWVFGTIVGNRTEKVMFVMLDRKADYGGVWFYGMRLNSTGPNKKVGVLGRYPVSAFRVIEVPGVIEIPASR